MKWKIFALSILMFSLIGMCYAENISVELLPNNIATNVGNTITLDLVVKNIPTDTKCGGFETNIIYNSNIINLTNINLSDISNTAGLKDIDLSTGKISLLWVSNLPSGNFTIATLTFKALNDGTDNISLSNVAISNENGIKYNNLIVNNSNVVITSPKPDLIISNIAIDNLNSYENNIIPVKVKNIGEVNVSDNFTVKAYIGTSELGEKVVSGLNVNEEKTLNFEYMPLDNKNYTITAIADSNNEIIENNETNNQYTKIVSVTEKPISLNIIPSTNITKTDEKFTINITLNNITSNRPAKGIDGVLLYNPDVLSCENFTFLLNSTENLENITYGNGNITFSIMDGIINSSTVIAKATFKAINVGNSNINLDGIVVSDINGYKFNNILSNTENIIVEGPNIKILNISTGQLYYQTPTTINVTITNNGYQDIINKSFNLKLYADTNEFNEVNINTLNVGETKTICYNWTPTNLKTYTFVALVDSLNTVSEENEIDNKLVVNSNVLEKPAYLKIYKSSENNGKIYALINIENIDYNRPCSGYDINISLKNLKVVNISAIGQYTNNTYNNSIFISSFNFTKYGKFNIVNITFEINNINNSYSAIITKSALSDVKGYKFNKIYVLNSIIDLESLKTINVDNGTKDTIDEDKIKYMVGDEFNVTIIPFSTGDNLTIPIVSNISINITNNTINSMEEIKQEAEKINNNLYNNEEDMNNTIDSIMKNIKPILNQGFNITNITKGEIKEQNNNILSKIRFNAINTSNKGFTIIRLPIGNLNIDSIIINNGTENISLIKDDINNKIGWYRIPIKGVLEIILVKDPLVEVSLSAPVTTINNNENNDGSRDSSGGSSSSYNTITTEYNGVAKDIKSEKIKQFVYKAKLILGSNVDLDLSAKNLKDDSELIKLPTEIKEDCILVGGEVANPLVKKYQWTFKVKVTNNNPGKNKGVIQKQLINGHEVVLLAGSDRYGTKAAVEYFKTLDDIPDEPIFVKWENGKAVKIE